MGDWLSILGYNAGYMDSYNDNDKEYYSAFGDNNADGQWSPYLLQGGQLKVSERGSRINKDLGRYKHIGTCDAWRYGCDYGSGTIDISHRMMRNLRTAIIYT